MFRENDQLTLLTFEAALSRNQRKKLEQTKEKWFYNLILCNINENYFRPLYSETVSRPNIPVNILVSALILKELKGLSYDELMDSVLFDLRFKAALGLINIDDVPFSRATLFNFQNRLLEYEKKTGINLFETVFDNLSAKQIKELSLKADIQRTDSTLISSNIKKYSRVQLLIEVLLRLYRILDDLDKTAAEGLLQSYLKRGSEKYVYKLKSSDLTHELTRLGEAYHSVFELIDNNKKKHYSKTKEYVNFNRVYQEHFVIVNQEITVKPTDELNSSMLQSPDDQEATFRKKREEQSKGFTINATETANQENPLQLLDDIVVSPNNIDDTKILGTRIEKLKEKTPDLNEMHTDGGYGSKDNDKKFEQLGITQVTTAIRGRQSAVEIKIEQISQSPVIYSVKCPLQKATSVPTKQRYKVRFDLERCPGCSLMESCRIFKNKGRFYFKHEDYLTNKRNNKIKALPKERQKIRPNIEATMKQFKCKTNAGQVKVRGLFKTSLFAYSLGIAINFGRIFRYITDNKVNTQVIVNDISEIVNFFAVIFSKSPSSDLFVQKFWLFAQIPIQIPYRQFSVE